MSKSKTMSLALLTDQATGNHPASWIHPDTSASASTDINHFRAIAQLAERGKFDMFFVADTPAVRTENLHAWSRFPMYMNQLEPVTLLTALAGATTHIGLGGTVSTSFSEPYNVARQFVSLDLISGGRAGWNVVTSANDYAARNFGHTVLPPHALRYERAERVRRCRARALGHAGRTAPSSATRRAASISIRSACMSSTTTASSSRSTARSTSSARRRAIP